MVNGTVRLFRRFRRARRGSVLLYITMTALAIIAMASFAIDLGAAYVARSQNQLVADLAAYSGGIAYSASSTTSAITYAVSRMATLNGLTSAEVAGSLVTSPTGDGNSAVQATVVTSSPAYLASSIGQSALSVKAIGYAEMRGGTPGCITALQSSGTGLSATGGTSITATNCTVASNGTVTGQASSVYVKCGATITTATVDYASANVPVQANCTDILPPTGTSAVTFTHATSTDALASNTEVTAATARIATVAALASPAGPSVAGGAPLNFGYGTAPTMPSGCTVSPLSGSTWNVSCNAGTYTFQGLSASGGLTVNFATNTVSGSRTFKFNGDINGTAGTAISFGSGTYIVSGGIGVASGLVMTFGSSTGPVSLTTGTSTSMCGAGYSVCISGGGSMTVWGPGTYSFAGAISQAASGMPPSPALWLGRSSTANSYAIGANSTGTSISLTGGSFLMGDATGSGGAFTAAGGITSTGSTCLQLPATNEHDINGSMNLNGATVMGAGIYTVNGYFAVGAATGGTNQGNCPSSGVTTGLTALGVSIIISGTSTVTCDQYAGAAFCLGQGFSNVSLTAPTASSAVGSSTAGLAVVGPTSSSYTGAADFTSGATNTQISGAFYFPYGTMMMSGGAALHDTVDSSPCLELIAASITLSAGSVLGSTCVGLPGSYASGGSNVSLVQ